MVSQISLVNILLICVSQIYGSAIRSSTEPSLKDNSQTLISLISSYFPYEDFYNSTKTDCPSLWTQTDQEFKEKEEVGVLGSIQNLKKLCPNEEKPTQLCRVTFGISSYVCKANEGSPLPQVKDLNTLSNPAGLCDSLAGNSNLADKLCDIMKTATQKSTSSSLMEKNKTSLNEFCQYPTSKLKEVCDKECSGSNQQLCKTVLQSLRTIISWGEVKKNSLSSENMSTLDSTVPVPVGAKSSTLGSTLYEKNTTTSSIQGQESTPTVMNSMNNSSISSTIDHASSPASSLLPETSSQKVSSEGPKTSSVPDSSLPITDFDLDPVDEPPKSGDDDTQFEDDAIDQHQDLLDEDDPEMVPIKVTTVTEKSTEERKPDSTYDSSFEDDGDPINTHFIYYFIAFVILSACGYLAYIRRKCIVAYFVEGRTDSRRRSGSFRNRSASGSYRKLVNNLEEAVTSHSVKTSNVIY